MTALLAAALTLLPAAPAAAQEPAAVSTAAVGAEIAAARRNLGILQEHYADIPAGRLDALLPQLRAANAGLRTAIGEKILAETAAAEKEAADKLLTEQALAALREMRGALQAYYSAKGGKYPQDLSELAPAYIAAIPEVAAPGHAPSAAVKKIDSSKYDKNYPRAVDDEGGWVYFSDRGSQNYGLLILNCSHDAADGLKFYEY